ncbi:MAG TPA: DUF1858 domain-containing protein [Bacteroidales bacterium]|nr:DUF1858 domain-containing protein [Bacteroidales bacterium]
MDKLIITPKTKVGEMLDAFPQLEAVLLELSPSFAKLKNPILRKTVARVASLQQAAVVGGLKVDVLVNRLRKEVGQGMFSENTETGSYTSAAKPDWLSEAKIKQSFDATPVINSGGSPMADILNKAQSLKPDEILELKTPFVPAPIIDLLTGKGFKTFSTAKGGEVTTYIIKG